MFLIHLFKECFALGMLVKIHAKVIIFRNECETYNTYYNSIIFKLFEGDSGSGLYSVQSGKWTILGIVSTGGTLGCSQNPYVLFTNVQNFYYFVYGNSKIFS